MLLGIMQVTDMLWFAGARTHAMASRDVYDVAVRWRQVSEPFDPVFYIDGLTRAAFEEGFGLQTPMVSGQNLVVRYYPQVRKGVCSNVGAVAVYILLLLLCFCTFGCCSFLLHSRLRNG